MSYIPDDLFFKDLKHKYVCRFSVSKYFRYFQNIFVIVEDSESDFT